MIEAPAFVDVAAREFGYRWYAGVPCSFLTPFINYTIGDRQLRYVSAANEGDAVAAASGAVLGGCRAVAMMQNSGLGNAISPLTSLTYVFRIPILLIVTLRGEPGLRDEPQHELMGRITGRLLDTVRVPWEYFPTEATEVRATLERAEAHMLREQRPYAFIMRKGSVAPYALPTQEKIGSPPQPTKMGPQSRFNRRPEERLTRTEALSRIVELTPLHHTVVIATTGYTGRELFALADRPNQLYVVGSMGCASSLGLGLAMARPDRRVVVIDGDGAALMRMGNFATLGAYGGANLVHLVLDNEAHDSTGGQATVSSGVNFAGIAQACGYPIAAAGDELALLDTVLADTGVAGPRFGHLKIRPGAPKNLPRPTLKPPQVRQRLLEHIASSLEFILS